MIKRKSGAAVAVILSLLAASFSCTRVDDTLGQGLIPDNERMKLKIDTITGINAFLTLHDSFPTANLSSAFIGSMQSPEFGTTRAGAVMQYLWVSGFDEDSDTRNFGIAPKADSLVLYFSVSPTVFGGDTSVVSKFNIYEVKERIFKDSAYFADHDISRTVDLSRVIGSFSHKGGDAIRLSMTGPNAEDLMRRLLDTTGGAYRSDSLFFNIFKGLYIAPADDSPANAAINTIEFVSSTGYFTSYMALYARNFTDNTATEVKDTLNIIYSFANAGVSSGSPIGAFNVFQHDYTGTQFQNHLNDTLTTSTPVELGYVQSLGGVTTYLRFTADFVRELKSKITAPYSSMAVNRAELQLPVTNPTPEVFNRAPNRLGSYVHYGPSFGGISDYAFALERTYSLTLPYGGYLNHSRGVYMLNIASFIQHLANRAEIRDYTFTVGPAFYEDLYGFSEVELKTGVTPTEPLGVILTYTLIR